jgi:two-component system chemotaxis sensor kinase CheA
MELNEYLPMFLAESREHLQELNLAIVRLEEEPDDRDTVDEVFRIAHSLKGMSATMGFAAMAALTHEMEDVFELLRQRRGGLGRDAIDVLLECLDALSGAVEAVDESGEERLDHEPLVDRLRTLTREPSAPQEPVDDRPPEPAELVEVAAGRRVVHVRARLADDVLMPGVRAFQVLQAAGEHGEVVHAVPSERGVEDFDGRDVEVWVASEHEEAAIAASVAAVPDVASAAGDVSDVPGEGAVVEAVAEDPAAGEAGAQAGGPAHRKATSSTVRVDAERLDQLMHCMAELVVHRTQLEALASDVPELQQAMQDLTRSSQALQAMVMQVRMVPVEAVFLRFPRLVRDLQSKLGKKVELVLTGKDTELDRTVVDALGDPIVHLVRNALDHGLEPPDERLASGKPETGVMEIAARHAGGKVVISVTDDGRGIDPDRVARKAVERGLIPEDAAEGIDAARAAELLFLPGFSTAEQTSDISGRGVGMDAVRAAIRGLGGEVSLTSEIGAGTTAEIRLPLTLAIMSALLVEAGGLPFAIPLDRVEHTLSLTDHTVRSVAGRQMLVQRDSVLPLLDAASSLGHGPQGDSTRAVIVRSGEQRVALAVDELVGQRELVTRPLPPELAGQAAVSGGAVLANGQIALIVDCDALTGWAGAAVPVPELV